MRIPISMSSLLLLSSLLAPTAARGVDLERAIRDAGGSGQEWLVYQVESSSAEHFVCCYGREGGITRQKTCRLEGKGGSWTVSSESRSVPVPLRVFLAVEQGRVERVHAYSAGCKVETTWPVQELEEVGQEESLHVLAGLAREPDAGRHHRRSSALAAIAGHLAPGSVRALAQLSEPGRDADLREQALFWLGQTRSPLAVEILSRSLDDEPSGDLREHILFSLSQTGILAAAQRIRRAAEHDVSSRVRGHAWFCLAQTGDSSAEEAIAKAAHSDPDRGVREQAVFALSQLPEPRAVDALLRVLRGSKESEVQRQALFWLAESSDPRALEVISGLLDG